jgi:putative membrane protein
MNNAKEENTSQLRDWLAVERTKLANQRTLLAMLRTGLYFLVLGLSVISIEQLDPLQQYYWIFFVIGIGFISTGIIYYLKLNKTITSKFRNTL